MLGMVLLASFSAWSTDLRDPDTGRRLKVFVLAGQSNMEGRADGDLLSPRDRARLAAVQDRVQLAFNNQPACALDVVRPAKEIGEIYQVEHILGPELFFGIALAEAWPDERILLIKYTAGATSLHGAWHPDWSVDKAAAMGEENGPRLYEGMMGYVERVLAGYGTDAYQLCAMLWVQGETDSGKEPASSQYGENLRSLVARVRQDLRSESLPFLLFQVGRGKVVDGMKDVARSVDNVHLIPQSSEPESPDFFEKIENGHYNHEGQKKLGLRFAQRYLDLD